MEQLRKLYKQLTDKEPTSIELLPGSGSNRLYYRLNGNPTVIGVKGTSAEENHSFITLAKHFTQQGLPVPHILATSDDEDYYLQTDLGDTLLYQQLEHGRNAGGRYSEAEKDLLHRTIRRLPDMQFKGANGLDFSCCYPQPELDSMGIHFDLNYFKYCFLKATGIEFNEIHLEHDFDLLTKDLLKEKSETFLYRDFQARNVMLDQEGNPHFIDFQGGRKGPIYYDVASFLWQAAAKYPNELREELIDSYLDALKPYLTITSEDFHKRLHTFVLFRQLQVLGAYGYRGYFEKKSHFLLSIPPALENLRQELANNDHPYPYLIDLLNRMCALPQFAVPAAKDRLIIRIFSFSYRKGIPDDVSGNGGGYVFDCRSTHNPGRYEPYKHITGLDQPVIDFLEKDGEITTFLESVYKLADAHVSRYLERGFTDLMFSFGCTGGQHRSVYSAQHLAEHLNQKFGVEVQLCHREQKIHQILPAKTTES